MRRLFSFLAVLLLCVPASAQLAQTGAGLGTPAVGCSQATAFLARTSGLDATHQNAYTTLICGLVTDGIWAKLDAFYVFATSTTTIALLNLVSTSFSPATANGSPTFTTDVGYTGVDASTTVYIQSPFIPNSSGGLYTQNSAHFSLWNNSNITSTHPAIGMDNAPATNRLYPKFTSDSKDYFRINEGASASGGASTVSDARGMFTAVRTGASTQFGYLNGVDQGVTPVASAALTSVNFTILTLDNSGTIFTGAAYQICAASIGGALTATDAANFYTLLHAYLVTIAGIAY